MNKAPNIKSESSTHSIMLDVIISLIPAVLVSIFLFGARVPVIIAVSICSALLFEWLSCKVLQRQSSLDDLSAVVTAILFSLMLPVSVPLWLPALGMLIAIVLAKQLFGGIGKNILNPALTAWATLRLIFPSYMTYFTAPRQALSILGGVDAEAVTTPLGVLYEGGAISGVNWLDMLLGQTAGCLGATSAVALMAGGVYLLIRKVISYRTAAAYLGTAAVIAFIFPGAGLDNFVWTACQLFGGTLMLNAVYMANDYTTSPVTKAGQWAYGFGCGAFTMLFRYLGAYPDGAPFAILIMNLSSRALDMLFRPGFIKKLLVKNRKA